jgi:hypothetical protein
LGGGAGGHDGQRQRQPGGGVDDFVDGGRFGDDTVTAEAVG